MPTYFRNRIALIARTGLLVLATATLALAQAPASDSFEGVVRISDRGVAAGVQQAGGECATTYQSSCTAPNQPCQSCQNCQGCEDCHEGEFVGVVHEGHGCHLTGNPLVDWCTVHKMKMDAAVVCQWYTLKAKCGFGHHGDCDDDCEGHHRCKMCHRCHRGNCRGNGNCNGGCNGDCNGCNGDCDDCNRCHRGCCLCNPSGYCGYGTPVVDCYSMVYPTLPQYADPRDGKVYSAEGYNVPVAVPLAPNVGYTMNYGWGIPSSRLTPISRFINEQGVVPPPQYGR